ncbi:TonB-dependent receptor [Pseudoduganella lutea]|uniref:TonB-dependent receptor n=2 Tax=Pseudoduganella lutea TaxID=321985 RepID=A0A4P6L3I9_9BURK|nr:TonB-dependent receptor [Pseudoduganella lutea]
MSENREYAPLQPSPFSRTSMNAAACFRPRAARHSGPVLRPLALIPFTLVPFALAGAATAQTVEASAMAPAAEPQVVTVSANRRREPAREVPMQVDMLRAEQLEQAGAKMLSDYLANQPGVDVKNGGGAGFGSISIRGVSTGDQTIATVGTYIDDVAYGSSTPFALGSVTSLDMALLDLHHIELLRGPQGTLYGAGAMGGLLKYVTNEPNPREFSGKAAIGFSATRGGRPGHTENIVLNVPLRENVAALRVAAFNDKSGGYIDATGPAAGANINGGRNSGARVSVLVEPGDKLKVRLTATAQNTRRDSTDYVDYDAATGRPSGREPTRHAALREPYDIKVRIAAADIEYDFGWARLNAITARQTNDIDLRLDYTGVYAPLLAPLGLDLAGVGVHQSTQVRKWTQEFRLTSPARRTVEWLAGLFYDDQRGGNEQLVGSTLAGTAAAPGPDLLRASVPSEYRELAAYGDVTWNATARLALTAGLRVARNEQDYHQRASGMLMGEATDIVSASKDTSTTYMATARYALDATSNVYVRAASGYRPGGPNAVLKDFQTGATAAPPTFDHDELWSYELGYKADLLGRKLGVEAAVYDIRWDDIQQFYAVNGINVIVNAGKAHIQGAELNLQYRPAANWQLTGALTWIDARLSEDAPGLARNGARLPNTARVSASVGTRYSGELAGRPAYAGFDARYVGKRNAGFDENPTLPNYVLPSYAMVNLQAGMTFGATTASVYVNNLLDRRAQLAGGTGFVPYGAPVNMTVQRPRTAGVMLTREF